MSDRLAFHLDLDPSSAIAGMRRVAAAADELSKETPVPDFRQRFAALVAVDRVSIHAEAPSVRQDGTTATLRLYDPIDSYGGTWGVSSKEMASALDELPDTVEEIRLLINSPGGEVFEGIAILNLLRRHKARVVAVVEGIAASSASFIACGCDEVVMAPNSELMVHDAWGLCVGSASDMRTLADDLDRLSDNIASVYAAKTGGTVAEWREVMANDQWYSAEDAVAAGLADSIDSNSPDANTAKARHDLTVFNLAGRKAAQTSATPPSPTPTPGQEGVSMPDLTKLRDALGLAEDITDDQVVDWLAAEAQATPPAPEPSLPDGVVAIDAAQLDQLRANAAAGVEARTEQLAQHRASVVAAAVADGRIPPARAEHWTAQLEADPGAETVLAGLAKGTIPIDQIGAAGAADLDTEFAETFAIYGKDA